MKQVLNGINMTGTPIRNVPDPALASDPATMGWVQKFVTGELMVPPDVVDLPSDSTELSNDTKGLL